MTYPFVQATEDYGVRKGPMLAFVVHMAEGGGTVGFLSKPDVVRGVSVHYVIEDTGRIVQMLREDHASGSINPKDIRTTDDPDGFYGATAAKAVLGAWWKDPNSAVISCEVEGFAKVGPNSAQHGSLKALISDVRSRYPEMGLLGHRDFADYKACPGRLIHWDDLGGHGPHLEDSMFPIRIPGGARSGTVTIPRFVHIFPLTGRKDIPARSQITAPAVSAVHDVIGGSAGFLFTQDGDTYWVRKDDVTFTPASADSDTDAVKAAVNAALDHLAPALDAVETAITEARIR